MTGMRSVFLPIVRHLVAIVVAWIGTALALDEVQMLELAGALTTIGLLVFAMLWSVVEKMLKVPFRQQLGEQQPGDTAPPRGTA